MKCEVCGQVCGSAAGLASHRRSKHESASAGGPSGLNVVALERTVSELERLGRFEEVDSAAVQAVRSMAAALDENPFNAQMWREYRAAVEALTDDGDDDGDLEALIEELSSA